jgi:hypothetical protein
MDMKSATPSSWEPASIDMGLSIESEMDNRGEEKKGRTTKYRTGKRKEGKNRHGSKLLRRNT